MRHGLMYHGSFEENYPLLTPGTTQFVSTDGTQRPLPEWPEEVTGVHFGYMEKTGKRFVAVRMQFREHDVVLQTPVVLDSMRHLGSRRFGPEPTVITDDLASALLDDAIECNPEQNEEIALLINRVNQVRRGD